MFIKPFGHLIALAIFALILTACGEDKTQAPAEKPTAERSTIKGSTAPSNPPMEKTTPVKTAELDPMLKRGRIIWFKCRSCHALEVDGPHKVGPSLNGLMGSPAATKEGFVYSKAMMDSGVIWDEKSLDAFIQKPTAYIKGTKMAFIGIKKESDRQALIKYIKENAQ